MPPIDGLVVPVDVAGAQTHSAAEPLTDPPEIPLGVETATGVDGAATTCAGCVVTGCTFCMTLDFLGTSQLTSQTVLGVDTPVDGLVTTPPGVVPGVTVIPPPPPVVGMDGVTTVVVGGAVTTGVGGAVTTGVGGAVTTGVGGAVTTGVGGCVTIVVGGIVTVGGGVTVTVGGCGGGVGGTTGVIYTVLESVSVKIIDDDVHSRSVV